MENNIIFLDANTFYDFCAIFERTLPGLGQLSNENVDYTKLRVQLTKLFKNNRIGITPVLIYELISHFRNDQRSLYDIFKFLKDIQKTHNCHFKLQIQEPFFNLNEPNEQQTYIDLVNKKIDAVRLVTKIVESKKISEIDLLSIFAFTIVHSYIIANYAKKIEYQKALKSFNEIMISQNMKLVMDEVKTKIQLDLNKAYLEFKEKQSFRRIFIEVLEYCAELLLYQLDYIKDSLDNKKTPSFDFSDILRSNKSNIIDEFKKWFRKKGNKEEVEAYIKEFGLFLKTMLSYTDTQLIYLDEMITSLYSSGTKIDKNDAEDFWYLGLIRENNYLLSFDKQVISAIEKSNANNYNFIKQFFK